MTEYALLNDSLSREVSLLSKCCLAYVMYLNACS